MMTNNSRITGIKNNIYFVLTLHIHHGLSGGSATHHPHLGAQTECLTWGALPGSVTVRKEQPTCQLSKLPPGRHARHLCLWVFFISKQLKWLCLTSKWAEKGKLIIYSEEKQTNLRNSTNNHQFPHT